MLGMVTHVVDHIVLQQINHFVEEAFGYIWDILGGRLFWTIPAKPKRRFFNLIA